MIIYKNIIMEGKDKSQTGQIIYILNRTCLQNMSNPGGSSIKKIVCITGDMCWIPELGRCPGEGNSNPLQYSCLGNSMDRGV